MRFRAKIVHVVVAGLPVAGCTTTEPDTKSTPKTDTATKTETKADPNQKPEPKPEPKPDPKPTIVVEKPEDIPVALGGVAMPYEPPIETPPPKGDGKAALAPAPAPAPEARAAEAPAAAAPAAPAATAPQKLALAHNHAPGEPCKPLTREEVETALADLKK